MKNIQYVWILICSMALLAFKCSNTKITQNQEASAAIEESSEEEDYYDDDEETETEADTVSYDDWEMEEEVEDIDTTNIQ